MLRAPRVIRAGWAFRTRSVAFDMTRYQETCGRLDHDDLDLQAAFARRPLPPDLLRRVVRYMHDVEQHMTCYMRNLLNTKAHDDPEITEVPRAVEFRGALARRGAGRRAAGPRPTRRRTAGRGQRDRLRNRISNSPSVWGGISSGRSISSPST